LTWPVDIGSAGIGQDDRTPESIHRLHLSSVDFDASSGIECNEDDSRIYRVELEMVRLLLSSLSSELWMLLLLLYFPLLQSLSSLIAL
jgi:hypothetical protein